MTTSTEKEEETRDETNFVITQHAEPEKKKKKGNKSSFLLFLALTLVQSAKIDETEAEKTVIMSVCACTRSRATRQYICLRTNITKKSRCYFPLFSVYIYIVFYF